MLDHSQASVIITGLFHDLVLKRSSVSVMWVDNPDVRTNLPVPFGRAWTTFRPRQRRPCANCPRLPLSSGSICQNSELRHAGPNSDDSFRRGRSCKPYVTYAKWRKVRRASPSAFSKGPLPLLADTVAKVEKRPIPKISRKLIFRRFCCCNAPQRRHNDPSSFLCETIRSPHVAIDETHQRP
jgi:hypothetical protein